MQQGVSLLGVDGKLKRKVMILGASGNCIDILDTLCALSRIRSNGDYECVGLLDDDEALWGEHFHGTEVLGPLSSAAQYRDCFFVNGIGSPMNYWLKREIIATTAIPLDRFINVIHPSASVSPWATLGRGIVVLQNATVASNAEIGNHVIILPNSIVSHDCRIGDFVTLAGGVCLSGRVTVGESSYLGSNCSVREDTMIGARCLVGMGSVVLDDVPEASVIAGVPGRILRKVPHE